jgi:hypothetical protein
MNQMRTSVSKDHDTAPAADFEPTLLDYPYLSAQPTCRNRGVQSSHHLMATQLTVSHSRQEGELKRAADAFRRQFLQGHLDDIGNGEAMGVQYRRRFRLNLLVNLYGQDRHIAPSSYFKFNSIRRPRQRGFKNYDRHQ